MKSIFTKSFLSKIHKSKTLMFNTLIAVLGVVEWNLHLFYDQLGNNYGAVFMLVAIINVILRTVTTQSLDDK